jgi:hypothetical protein
MDSVRKMVEEHLPSLLREDGLRNNDLMVWLGVIQIPLEVEAIVRVGYRGIRACLEEVDQTILGGEGKRLEDQRPGIGMYCIRYSTCSFDSSTPRPPTRVLLSTLESFGQVPTQSAIHNDN